MDLERGNAPIERYRDLDYLDTHCSEHTLDVYRPTDQKVRPVVIHVHGGGFQILSKDTHWMIAEAFAREGYVVANINYRLSPEHKYPKPLIDVARAIQWVVQNIERYGGDPSKIILAGESAGANLITSAAIAMTTRRQERWARELFELGIAPTALVPACGMLQVSDPERMLGDGSPRVVFNEVAQASRAYLPQGEAALADPLLRIEEGLELARPWPDTFIVAGGRDPLRKDSQRLFDALERSVESRVSLKTYEGEVHSFHAFFWRENARRAWAETFEFLDAVVGRSDAAETAPGLAA